MTRFLNGVAHRVGVDIRRYQSPDRVSDAERVVTVDHQGAYRGRALVSYVLAPFLRRNGEAISNDHTHDWESHEIVSAFSRHGFSVDVISYMNTTFQPSERYDVFFAARTNFDRIADRLPRGCARIVHLDTAHWLFNNTAAYQRLLNLQQRRGVTLNSVKMVEPNFAIENADRGTVLGNAFTLGSYAYAGKPLQRINISAPCQYDWNADKDFEACRRHYVWFGSSGFVHKGLDLVLEAFAGMPDCELTVCGPFDDEAAFVKAFHRELYELPNIRAEGWVDVAGKRFLEIARNSVGLVYPSCSEGGGGSAITCMHAGLIPILTRETSVDIGAAGVLLSGTSVAEIQQAVQRVSAQSASQLEMSAREAWDMARQNHTRARFVAMFDEFLSTQLLCQTQSV